jgi:hypothetical protein
MSLYFYNSDYLIYFTLIFCYYHIYHISKDTLNTGQ